MADEPDMLDDEESLPASTVEEASAFSEKLAALNTRCKAAGIDFKQEVGEEGEAYAIIHMQAGRDKRRLVIFSEGRADSLLSIHFEKYSFLSGYEAICSYESKTIEVGLRSTRMPARFFLEQLLRHSGEEASGQAVIELAPPSTLQVRPTIRIGPSSPEFISLGGIRPPRTTLKLEGARATQHDQALTELRSYADSLFFQLDMMYGSTFTLERERRIRSLRSSRRQRGVNLSYPVTRYSEEAMSLYWYAKSASDMPLLRYLAFYQCIEFYFPRYSQTEARKRVGAILKRPTFRPHRDDDLDRLISAIQLAKNGGLGSERQQLRAVVSECIGASDIRNYLMETKEREEYFIGKGAKARYHKIPIANKNADLRNDVADRIYDIRCKIVHTKNEQSDDELSMILPFSDDADYLLHDIDLAEYVARSVLISSSEELA